MTIVRYVSYPHRSCKQQLDSRRGTGTKNESAYVSQPQEPGHDD